MSLSLAIAEVLYRKGTVRDLAVALEIHKGVITVPQLKAVLPGDMVRAGNAAAPAAPAAAPAKPASPPAAPAAGAVQATGDFSLAGPKFARRWPGSGSTRRACRPTSCRARPQGQARLDRQRPADRRSRGRSRRPACHGQRRRRPSPMPLDGCGDAADRSLRPRRLSCRPRRRDAESRRPDATRSEAATADAAARAGRRHARARRRRRRPTRPAGLRPQGQGGQARVPQADAERRRGRRLGAGQPV